MEHYKNHKFIFFFINCLKNSIRKKKIKKNVGLAGESKG